MKRRNPLAEALTTIRVGLFLGGRQIRRTNAAMSVLIVGIMMLTFVNLVAITGILVGLPTGAQQAYRAQYSGDILISTPQERQFIEQSQALVAAIEALPEISIVSPRYMAGAKIEANYKDARARNEVADQVSVMVVGANPTTDEAITNARARIIEGAYLEPGDNDGIILSARIVEQYAVGVPGDVTLSDVGIGSKVRVTVMGNVREFTVRGILAGKAPPANQWAYMNDVRLREMMGRFDRNVQQIAVILNPGVDVHFAKEQIAALESATGAVVETSRESQGQFFDDIVGTFTILGNGIGSLGLIASGITVFIVIFISAITRRRYIGILKGIGISGLSIELAYVVQSLVYMAIGTTLGVALVYLFLIPFFVAHPIDFPFSDGILVAPIDWAILRIMIIGITTVFAGYVPAKIIVRQNTLDAILGR